MLKSPSLRNSGYTQAPWHMAIFSPLSGELIPPCWWSKARSTKLSNNPLFIDQLTNFLDAEIPILSCLKFPANPTPLASKHLHWRWVLRPAGPALTVRDAQPEGVHRAVDQPGKSVVEVVGLVQYRCCLILSKLGEPNNMNLKVFFVFTCFYQLKNYSLRAIPTLKHYSDIVSDIPPGSIYGIIRAFFLAYTLTFYLAFYLASVLTCFLAYILTFFLTFYLTFSMAPGWGPTVPNDIWI